MPLQYAINASSSCPAGAIASPIWQMINGSYVKASYIYGGAGYWVEMTSPCSMTFTGSPLTLAEMPSLTEGWNLIGALNYSAHFSSITGDCEVTRGPTGFNTGTGQYVDSPTISPGKGYFVKVVSDCTLASEPQPPIPV